MTTRKKGESEFPLYAIHDDAHLDAAIAKIDKLLDQVPPSPGAQAYLDALSDLVEHYEAEHITPPRVRGLDLLRHLMEGNGFQQKDVVDVFGSKSVVSEVLAGKRPLALSHLTRLSARFGLPVDVFLDRPAAP